MRRQVHAVVVLRHRSDHLVSTLVGLANQTHSLASTTVVDLTGIPDTEDLVTEHLRDTAPLTYLRNKPQTGWSEAVNQGRLTLLDDSGATVDQGWLWLLRDDTEPAPDALAHLVVAVDGAPSVVVAGPKQRMATDRSVLREFGETMTRWGQRQAIVDRELDQAQYDRMSDVLALGDAGLLVRIDVLDQLGGFDPALDPLDAPLDLGVRARLAGHRVLAVPAAMTYVGSGPADWRAGKNVGGFTLTRLDRAAWLYRRFVYAPWWAVLPLIALALPVSLVRALYFFVTKHPDTAIADLVATLQSLASLPRVLAARVRFARSKKVGWSSISPLRMTPGDRRRRREIASEERFAGLEEKARLRSRPLFWPGGLWMTLGLAALGAIIAGPLLGARALSGGGLLPLSPTLEGVWAGTRWLSPDAVQGMWGERLLPADPGATLFSLLGSLTWWEPSLAVVWLWPAALVLAGLIAWWAGSQILSHSLPTTVMAIAWAIAPTFLVALAEGRPGAVIAHLALPWLVATALTAHDSWQRAAQAGFATAVVVSAAPVLWPAVLIAWLVVIVGTGWRNPLRALLGTLPLVLTPAVIAWVPRFLAPTEGPLLEGLGRWLADPGVGIAYEAAPWWTMLGGWPTDPTTTVLAGVVPGLSTGVIVALSLPLLALAVAVVSTARGEGMGALGVLVPLGLVTALAAPAIAGGFAGDRLAGVWAGSAISLLWLGVTVAAATTLDALHPMGNLPGTPHRARRALSWSLAFVAVAGVAFAGVGEASRQWTGESPVAPLGDARVVPALVAADAPQHPAQGILVITDRGVDEPLRVGLLRGAGPRLDDTSSLYRQRVVTGGELDATLAKITASLVQETSDNPTEALAALGIRFVWFQGETTSPRAQAISRNPILLPASEGDNQVLWQVADQGQTLSQAVQPSPAQRQWDIWWFVVAALWGILALPTERRPRHQSEASREDETLTSVLEEPDDDR